MTIPRMASQVINQHPFAPGTVVAVFPAENLPAGASSPSGSSVAGGTVDAAGALTVTGTLEAKRRYVAFAGGRGVSFLVTPGSVDRMRLARLGDLDDVVSGDAAGVSVVQATGGGGDLALIQSALAGMRAGTGKLDGRLEVKGRARLTGTLVLDGGYVDTTPADANWATSTPESFELAGNFLVDPGVGVGISSHGSFNGDLDIDFHDGGLRGEVTDADTTISSAVVSSPDAIAGGISAGCVVFIDGAGQVAGGVNQPQAATVSSVNVGAGTITLQTTCAATVTNARMRWASVGLHVEDQVGLRLDLEAKNFAGCVLHGDATNITQKRMRSCQFGRLNFDSCGMGIFWRSMEAFGTLGDVWSNMVWSDYIGRCDDTAWTKYEGGIGGAGLVGGGSDNVAESYLWLDRCNNCNIGDITTGDRATEALLKITGPCDLGVVQKVRATGLDTARPGAGAKLIDVQSCEIQSLVTRDTEVGLHIIGGRDDAAGGAAYNEIVVGHHQSLTDDTVALKLEPSPISTAPRIRVGADYRAVSREAVRIEAGFTGGRVALSGVIDQHNSDNVTGPALPVIDCESGPMLLYVAGLFQPHRNPTYTAPSAIIHPTPANIRGMSLALFENAVVHGASPGVWPAPGQSAFATNGTLQQNLSGRTLNLMVLTRYQPAVGGAASSTVKFGATSATVTDEWADSYAYGSGAGNDFHVRRHHRIPPWWWIGFTLVNATHDRVTYWYE